MTTGNLLASPVPKMYAIDLFHYYSRAPEASDYLSAHFGHLMTLLDNLLNYDYYHRTGVCRSVESWTRQHALLGRIANIDTWNTPGPYEYPYCF